MSFTYPHKTTRKHSHRSKHSRASHRPGLRSRPLPERIFVGTALIVALTLVITGVVWYLNKPGDNVAPVLAPGPLVFQKVYRASTEILVPGDTPHTYEPAAFQLYEDGNLMCSTASDDAAKQFEIRHGKVGNDVVAAFIEDTTATGIDTLPDVLTTKDGPYAPGNEREVYSLVRNDELKSVVWSSAVESDKPQELANTDALIANICEAHATTDYVPSAILVQMGQSPYTKDEVPVIAQAQAESISPQLKEQIAAKLSPETAEPKRYFYENDDVAKLIKELFSSGTHVQIETSQGLLLATYSPTLPTEEDVDAQIQAFANYEMASAGLRQVEQYEQDRAAQEEVSLIDSIDQQLSGQAQATANRATKLEINFALFPDRGGEYDENWLKPKMESLSKAVANWYYVELGQAKGFQSHWNVRRMAQPTGFYAQDNCSGQVTIDCTVAKGANGDGFLKRLHDEAGYDPDIIRVFVIDSNQVGATDSAGRGGYPGTPHANTAWIQWDVRQAAGLPSRGGVREHIITSRGVGSYELGKGTAHEVGHNLGLVHTQDINTLRRFGAPVTQWNTDIQDNANAPFAFPADIAGNPAQHEQHLAWDQKQFILQSPLNIMTYNCPLGFCSPGYTPTIPPSQPAPPPTCLNGNLIRPDRYCDDGGWVVVYFNNTTFASTGVVFEIWQNVNTGECGMRKITGLHDAGAGYLYPIPCSHIDQLKQMEQARLINELGKKVFPIQDVGSARSAGAPRAITTNVQKARYSAKNSALRTWAGWEKPYRVDGPYGGAYDYIRWFIPDPHGLYNINTTKNYNFYGNIWGYIDGHYVAASNMGVYGKNVGVNQAFLFGPHENPGGNIANTFKNGKVMKVCWNIKDILAAETNNTQHSLVRLQVTSNGGAYNWTNHPYTIFGLQGTEFKQYCHDNLKPPASNAANLEYPVTYLNGSVAVESIERTIYWPESFWGYTINLPNYDGYPTADLTIKQSGVPGTQLTRGQCLGHRTENDRVIGCKLTKDRSIGVISTMFEAPKTNGNKTICVVGDLPHSPGQDLHQFYAHLYGSNQKQPVAALRLNQRTTLWNGKYRYCAQSNVKTFNRVVLSTSAPDPNNPALIESVSAH